MYPAGAQLPKLQEVASRLAKEDPADLRAAAYVQIVDIAQWLSGVLPTDKRMLATLDALEALQKKAPDNSEILFYAGCGRARLAQDALLRPDGRIRRSIDEAALANCWAPWPVSLKAADISFRGALAVSDAWRPRCRRSQA